MPACSTVTVSVNDSPSNEIRGNLSIHFIDVGEGDSTFIISDSGENMLIDAGSPSGGPRVVSYLKNMGVKRIDHLILTHPHDDHMGGVFSVLSNFEVESFYDSGFSNFTSTMYGDYISFVRKDLSRYHVLQAGEAIHMGSLVMDVVNPLLPPTGNLNNDSIVLRARFGSVRVLLSGDMGHLGERRLLHRGTELKSDVIKVGHHGEDDVCSDDFLMNVKPEAAIISVSHINKYARPHPELLRRLEKSGALIYRTDLRGHVVFVSDGKTHSLTSAK